jgi:hypothetical protein
LTKGDSISWEWDSCSFQWVYISFSSILGLFLVIRFIIDFLVKKKKKKKTFYSSKEIMGQGLVRLIVASTRMCCDVMRNPMGRVHKQSNGLCAYDSGPGATVSGLCGLLR